LHFSSSLTSFLDACFTDFYRAMVRICQLNKQFLGAKKSAEADV
jgi:hypothetical protein